MAVLPEPRKAQPRPGPAQDLQKAMRRAQGKFGGKGLAQMRIQRQKKGKQTELPGYEGIDMAALGFMGKDQLRGVADELTQIPEGSRTPTSFQLEDMPTGGAGGPSDFDARRDPSAVNAYLKSVRTGVRGALKDMVGDKQNREYAGGYGAIMRGYSPYGY